ncbi:MAG: metal-dependent transcriptional regulator [Treponema sp.]|jgi:DtxR family Mn-dependent transcriptional regulator|nr:metal-dependent transcriptional regulator [Treponema sp.]
MMTESLENYLETISFLSDDGEVRVTDIASRLRVRKPSVLTALKNLEEQGLLEHQRYGTVFLTAKGKIEAQAIRDRHQFLTSFLRDLLGVAPETAEADACKMEHLLSKETMQKMKNFVIKTKKNNAANTGAD